MGFIALRNWTVGTRVPIPPEINYTLKVSR